MLRDRKITRAALVLAVVLSWAWPVAADNTIGGSCSSVGQSGNSARNADGNNEWCNGTTWQYPAYQFGSTTNTCSGTTAGQVQYTNGTLEACNGTTWIPIGSNVSFISTQTASSSANLQFTNLPTGYSTLVLNCVNISTSISGNNSLHLYVGEGATPTWKTGATYTYVGRWACSNDSGTSYGQSDSLGNATDLIDEASFSYNPTALTIYLYNYSLYGFFKPALYQQMYVASDAPYGGLCMGDGSTAWAGDTNPLTGLELAPTSGTINAGECTLYAMDPQVWTGPLASGSVDEICSASPCTATITSTHGGDLLVVSAEYDGESSKQTISSITSAACPGGWVLNPGTADVFDSSESGGVAFAYCLSDASGQTSISVTMPGIDGFDVFEFNKASIDGAITNDGAVGTTETESGSTLPGETLTPTGTDLLLQFSDFCDSTAISSPYAENTNVEASWAAFWPNSTSGTAPTWTIVYSRTCTVAGLAFK